MAAHIIFDFLDKNGSKFAYVEISRNNLGIDKAALTCTNNLCFERKKCHIFSNEHYEHMLM